MPVFLLPEETTMTHYTHKTESGLFRLRDDQISVDGLEQPLVQYTQAPDGNRLILKDKWTASMRPLLPLEYHHCGRHRQRAGQGQHCQACFLLRNWRKARAFSQALAKGTPGKPPRPISERSSQLLAPVLVLPEA